MSRASVANDGFEMVNVETLVPHEQNPNRGNVATIERSIAEHGFYGALIVQRSTRRVLAGNHRLQAAIRAGFTEVPVIWVDVGDEDALRILLSDNQLAKRSTYDAEALLGLLRSMDGAASGLSGTGYESDDLDSLAEMLAKEDAARTAGTAGAKAEDEDDDMVQLSAWGVVIDCENEHQQVELIELLAARGLEFQVVLGAG